MKYALLAAAFVLSCSKEKGADCQTLVQAVGPQHAAFADAFGKGDQPASELEAQALAFEKGARDLRALPLKDEGVKTLATEFADVLDKAAKVRRELAGAATALDPGAASKAQATAVSLATEETRAKAKIDATCR